MSREAEQVDAFIAGLGHPMEVEIRELRRIVFGANAEVTETIKWNAPSFRHNGDDRVTMKLHPRDRVSLIFHRGAKKQAGGVTVPDPAGLLTWPAPDRAVATFRSLAEIEANREAIAALVDAWVQATA